MSRSFSVTVAFAALLAVSGCGFNSSPADNITFKAPAGWQASPGIMGFMQLWKAPGGRDEVLMLFRSPKQIATSDVMSSANVKDARIESEQRVTICGNQSAEFLKAQGSAHGVGSKADSSNVETMVSNTGGATYMAMYVYPIGGVPNAEATAALRELCAK
ncbi:MAG: hypothetical protein WCD38_06770 [Candidatus Tumulicola sp.]